MQCQANLKENFDDLLAPGDYLFAGNPRERPSSMFFVCPCGVCKDVSSVRIAIRGAEHVKPSWEWNESREKPTLTPSILRLDGCKWHGYLTDGVFVSC